MSDTNDLDPADPSAYPRRVLVSVAGLTPQVVTETVYALAVRQTPAFIPTEIVVVTTTEGARQVSLTLLGDSPGWFARLRRDYALPEIAFSADRIRVLNGPDGLPLPDIRTVADNDAAAAGLLGILRELTADPGCALHVSMAGGRKTMGFWAAYGLSLFGRPQDRLSHVLVSDPFESNRDFFYPTPERHVIFDRNNRPLDAARAEVMLAETPLLLLRDGIPAPLLDGAATPREIMTALQPRVVPPRLTIDLDRGAAFFGDLQLRLEPRQLALLTWIAARHPTPCPAGRAVSDRMCEEIDNYCNLLKRTLRVPPAGRLRGDANLRSLKSNTNKALKRALAGTRLSLWQHRLTIVAEGADNETTWALALPPGAARVIRRAPRPA